MPTSARFSASLRPLSLIGLTLSVPRRSVAPPGLPRSWGFLLPCAPQWPRIKSLGKHPILLAAPFGFPVALCARPRNCGGGSASNALAAPVTGRCGGIRFVGPLLGRAVLRRHPFVALARFQVGHQIRLAPRCGLLCCDSVYAAFVSAPFSTPHAPTGLFREARGEHTTVVWSAVGAVVAAVALAEVPTLRAVPSPGFSFASAREGQRWFSSVVHACFSPSPGMGSAGAPPLCALSAPGWLRLTARGRFWSPGGRWFSSVVLAFLRCGETLLWHLSSVSAPASGRRSVGLRCLACLLRRPVASRPLDPHCSARPAVCLCPVGWSPSFGARAAPIGCADASD